MADLERDLAQLDSLLHRLEKEYEMFIAGQLRREPSETEGQVLALVRTWSKGAIQNSTLAFRYRTLVARYNAFKTVWNRRVREREEGRAPAVRPGAKGRAAAGERSRPAVAKTHDAPAPYIAVDPCHEPRRMSDLYATYRRLREEQGESVERLRPDGFQRTLADRVAKIKEQYGCEAVLIRVVADGGRTRIVAKPYRRPGAGGASS